jgi:hypothetical protein
VGRIRIASTGADNQTRNYLRRAVVEDLGKSAPLYDTAGVAQANKTARIIWALLNKGGIYRRPHSPAITAVSV